MEAVAVGEGVERDHAAGAGVHVGGPESARAEQKLRGGLQHHVVLVERGVDGGDLRLAKTEVQRIINELRSDAVSARPRGGRSSSIICKPRFCWSVVTSLSCGILRISS